MGLSGNPDGSLRNADGPRRSASPGSRRSSREVGMSAGVFRLRSGSVRLCCGWLRLRSGEPRLCWGEIRLRTGGSRFRSGSRRLRCCEMSVPARGFGLRSAEFRLRGGGCRWRGGGVRLPEGGSRRRSGERGRRTGGFRLGGGWLRMPSGQRERRARRRARRCGGFMGGGSCREEVCGSFSSSSWATARTWPLVARRARSTSPASWPSSPPPAPPTATATSSTKPKRSARKPSSHAAAASGRSASTAWTRRTPTTITSKSRAPAAGQRGARRGEGRRLTSLHRRGLANARKHPREIPLDVPRRHAKDANPEERDELRIARLIRRLAPLVHAPIDLDDQPPSSRMEIDDRPAKRMLPPEVHPELIPAKSPPENGFAPSREEVDPPRSRRVPPPANAADSKGRTARARAKP
jgi:hypothetical protein